MTAPYPVNLRVAGRPCLVVGGGPVALQKVRGLLDAGAEVTVIAPQVVGALLDLDVVVERRRYVAGEAGRYRLVVTATGDRDVDGQVAADADAAGVWVNSADDPDHCSFTLPARLQVGRLLVTVSTDGASPAIATWLRDQLAAGLGPEYGALLELVAEEREGIRAEGGSTEGLNWRAALDSGMLELVREGRLSEAKELLRACLSSSSG